MWLPMREARGRVHQHQAMSSITRSGGPGAVASVTRKTSNHMTTYDTGRPQFCPPLRSASGGGRARSAAIDPEFDHRRYVPFERAHHRTAGGVEVDLLQMLQWCA